MKLKQWIIFTLQLTIWFTLGRAQNFVQERVNRTDQEERWNIFFQQFSNSKDDINLLAAVGSPLPPDVRPVTGPFGRYGRPAVEFTPQSYVGRWARDLLPLPFYKDFGIKVTIYLQSIQGGVLFTILEPDHSSIVLGLSILRVGKNNQSIEIVYKNPSKEYGSKELKATFVLPKFERRWIVFSIAISGQSVYLYFNGCEKVYSKVFEETRSSLVIKSNAPVFIGMAGWYIQKPVLFGAVYDLTIYKDYKKAIPSCSRTEKSSTQHSNIGTSESGKTSSTIKPNPTRSPIKTSTEEDLNEDKVNENNKVDLSNQENPGGPAVPKESDAAQTTTTSSSTTASKTTIPSTTTTKIATKTTQLSRSTTVSPKTTTTKTTTTTQLTKTSTLSPKTTKTKPTTTTQSTKTTTITPKTTTTTKTTTTQSTKTSTLSPKTTTTSKTTQPTKTTTVRPKTTTSLLKSGPAMTTTTPTTTQSTKTTKVIPKTAMLKTTTPRSTENSIKSKTLSPTKEEKNPSKTTILKTTTSSPQPTKENNFIYETTATKQDENKIKTTQGPKMHDPTTYKPDENIASILNLYTTQSSTESTAVPTTIVDEVETTLVTTQDSIASAETSTSSTTTREGRNVNTIDSVNSLIKNFHSKISENIDKLRPTEQVTRTKSKIEITDADTTNPNTITEDFSTTQQKLVTTAMPQESKTTHSTFVSSTKQISAMETSEDVFPTVATIHKTDYVTHAVTKTIQSSTSRMRDIITTKASTSSRDFDLKKDLEEEMKKLEKDINNLMNLTIVTTSSTTTINKKTVDKHDKTFPSKTTTTTPDTTKKDAKPNNVITTTMTIEHDVTKTSTNNKVDMKPNPTTITNPEDTTYKPSTASTRKTTTVPKVISTEKLISRGELTIDELTQQVSQRLKNQLNAEEADKMTIRSVIIEILEERKNGFMKGSKGEKGDSVKGERGRIGLPGVIGLKGRKGDTGPMGPSGKSGENGRPGLNGLKGDRGLKGESGEKGERGYDGKDGVPGAGVGLPGPIGPQGERGLKGEAGIDGKDGGPGKDGEKGQRGDNGGPGVDGETGPAGAKGEKGDSVIGPKGERGPPGLPTAIPIHARLEKVEVRHGRPGKDGKPGPIGEKGEAGPAGMKGETGPIGPPGKDGSKGEPGISITGEKGEKGATGKPGQDGIQGYSGDQGPRGFNGAKGEKGAKGDTAEASKESLKAHILLTTRDMRLMFDMFSPGSFVLISSTNELYVRSLFGWLKIMTGASASTSANSLSGPTYFDQRRKKQIPTPGLMDRRLMNTHLKVPSAGVLIPRPYLLLMALNAPQSGQMGGVVGADYLCHKQAEVVNLPGRTFRAFLSNSYQNIRDLVDQDTARLPVANFRGEKIFDSYESIYNATMFAAFNPKIPIYSFNNRDVRHDENWPIKKIWHGSHAHGEHHFNKKSCSNWKSNVKSKKATASSLLSYTPALNEELTRCHRKLIVLCIQTSLR